MRFKRLLVLTIVAALLAAMFTTQTLADSETIFFSQKFESQTKFDQESAKWSTDGTYDKGMLISGRTGPDTRAEIRLQGLELNKTYKLVSYIKNPNPSVDLTLIPRIQYWGSNGNGGYPDGGGAQNATAESGLAKVGATSDWYKYTQEFKLTDGGNGTIFFHGFALGIQVDGATGGYASTAFSFETAGDNAELASASYIIDDFTVYNITDGADPDTAPNGNFVKTMALNFNNFDAEKELWTQTISGGVTATEVMGHGGYNTKITSAAGKDGADDLAMEISGRQSWGDTAKIRFPELQLGKKYRLTTYIKNTSPEQNLVLTPVVSAWAADGQGGYLAGDGFGSNKAVIGKTSDWVKYTETFEISEADGKAYFHGFGMGIEVKQEGKTFTYAQTDFRFFTDMGIGLDNCGYILDDFVIYDITNYDPEHPPVPGDEDSGIEIGKFPIADGTFPILVQDFENPKTYFQKVGEKNFFNTPGKWGPMLEFKEGALDLDFPLELKPTTDSPHGGNTAVQVVNRSRWIDSPRVWIDNSMISANTTYRLTIYVKNADVMKPLRLSPGINLYGAHYKEEKVVFESKSAFLPQFVDLSSLGNDWYKLTTTFTIKENKDLGTLAFNGFEGNITMLDQFAGFCAFEFMLSTPMGEDVLDTASYFIDDFSIYDITNGKDPEADDGTQVEWPDPDDQDNDDDDDSDEVDNVDTGDTFSPVIFVLGIAAAGAVILTAKKRRFVK